MDERGGIGESLTGAEPGIEGRPAELDLQRALVATSVDGSYYDDVTSQTCAVSPQPGQALGAPDAEVPATLNAWRSCIHPDDRDAVTTAFAESLRDGTMFSADYRLQRSDGSYALVEDRARIIRDASGATTHVAGVIEMSPTSRS